MTRLHKWLCSVQFKGRFLWIFLLVVRLAFYSVQCSPPDWMSRRASTLYLFMWFWSFQIRAVRAVCRHEAQAEYTNPAAAWHRTHTQTLPQRLKVTVCMSQSVRRQEKNKWKNMEINDQHFQGKIRCNLWEILLFFVMSKALSLCLRG